MSDAHTVAILGASPKAERPSHLACQRYRAAGWTVWPIHPTAETIDGIPCFQRLEDLPGLPDIYSLYVGPARLAPLMPALLERGPAICWFNPGTEDEALEQQAAEAGMRCVTACNLVGLGRPDLFAFIDQVTAT